MAEAQLTSHSREPKRFGTQVPPLTKTIKDILERYPDGGQILKELIQNADDARASCVKFLVDPRKHSTENLWKESLQPMQEPALVAYNDAMFTSDDWESIGDLSQNKKAEDILKVGRFGIGFQSVHHITDLPVIVSGKYVGILDPHRHHISEMKKGGTVEGGKLFTVEEFCTYENQATLFNNMFGFQKNMEEFNGTLFRFPFRTSTSKSELSNTMYTEDKVTSELYKSFQFEAEHMLLFLKHVISIELYVWEDSKPKRTFCVSITEASKRNVRRMHEWAKLILDRPDHAKSTHTAKTSLFTCTVEVNHCENMGSDAIAHYTWLVSNTIGYQDAGLNEASKELKVAPWVGLATRVPADLNIAHCTFPFTNVTAMFESLVNAVGAYKIKNADRMDMQKGYIFCFLPLPLAIPGLPVNIHGYFSIDSNRRGIKWPSHDVKGRDAEWNKQLILKLLIPSYAVFIAAKSIWFTYSEVDSLVPIVEAPYTWWPVPNHIEHHPTWKILYPCLPKLLLQLPVFWTLADGGQWITAEKAIFLSISVPDAIIEMLTRLKLSVVVLPKHVQDSFEKEVKIASSRDICSWLKIKCDCCNVQNILSNLQLLKEFLIYACGDVENKEFDHLVGLPIIPIATDSPPRLLQRKSGSSPDLLVMGENQDTRSILHGLEDRIVCTEISADIEALMISMARTELFNLKILSRDDVLLHLKESMLTWCSPQKEVTWRPGQDGHPPKEWLSNVWIWITKQEMHPDEPNDMAVVHKANGLPLIPVYSLDEDHSKQENILLPLTVNANGYHNLLYCDSNKNNSIVQIVKKLGFRTVEPSKCISDVIAVQPKMASAIPMLTPQSLLQSQFLKNAISAVNCTLDGNDRCILRTYLFECLKTDEGIKEVLLTLLRSLPLHSIQSNSLGSKESDHFTVIRDPRTVIFLSPGINPPTAVDLPLPVLNYDPKDLDSYNALLGRKPLEVKEFIKDHILSRIARTPDDSSKDIKKSVALWILEYIEEGDKDLISALCNVRFVTSMNDAPCYARDLVDRTDPEMKLFHGTNETNMFLHSDYDLHLNKIRLLGLQTWDNICATKEIYVAFVTERANWIASQNRSRGHDLEQISRNIVKKVYTMFKDDFKDSAWNALQTIPFVFCEDAPPNHYVGSWKGYEHKDKPLSPTQLCVPSDRVVASELPYVVGSVYPLPSAHYEGLLERAGICHEVTFEDALQHIQHVTADADACFQVKDVSHTVEKVYTFLQNLMPLERKAKEMTHIWIEEESTFVDFSKIVLDGSVSLKPYRFRISELDEVNKFRSLWKFFGIKEQFLTEDYIAVLHEMQTKGKLDSSSMTTCLNLLSQLQSLTRECSSPDDILLPTVQQHLHNSQDCVYDNRKWISRHPSVCESFAVVHSDVPNEQAIFFGTQSLSTVLGNPQPITLQSRGKKSFLQFIREKMPQFKDTLHVFKELIQNADDAGATEVKFLIDWRQHPTENLFTDEMRHWQGPALYAYNNSVFTDEDFKNICDPGCLCTRRMSVNGEPCTTSGFCSVYHYTDVPMLISGSKLMVCDPHGRYLYELAPNVKNSVGVFFDLVKDGKYLKEYYFDQLKPFDGVFGIESQQITKGEALDCTIFRLPLRSDQVQNTSLPGRVFRYPDTNFTTEVVKKISLLADRMLLFTNNVVRAEVYERRSNTKESRKILLIRKSSTSPSFGYEMSNVKNVIIEWCEDFECTSKINTKTWMMLDETQTNPFMQEVTLAVPLKKDIDPEYGVPCPLEEGSLSSFLPLGHVSQQLIFRNWKFVVNIVRKLRNNLTKYRVYVESAKDASVLVHQIENAVQEALLSVLFHFASHWSTPTEEHLRCYYSMWIPNDTFLQKVFASKKRLLFTENKTWKPMDDISVINASLTKEQLGTHVDISNNIIHILLKSNFNITKLPPKIAYFSRIKDIDFKCFCKEALFPLIRQLRDYSSQEQVETVVKFVLEGHIELWLRDDLKTLPCIPTIPSGRLRRPCELVDQSDSTLCSLYSEKDEVFPQVEYLKMSATLHRLGMKRSHLSLECKDIFDRAKTILTLSDISLGRKRCLAILSCLSSHQEKEQMAQMLSSLPFLPVEERPPNSNVPWNCGQQFAAPENLYLPQVVNLVYSQHSVLSVEAYQQIGADKHGLRFKNEPPLNLVLKHFCCLIDWFADQKNEFFDDDADKIAKAVSDIYNFIDKTLRGEEETVRKNLTGRAVVWDGMMKNFVHPTQVSLQVHPIFANTSLSPYWRTSNEIDCLRLHSSFWNCLQVKKTLDPEDAMKILHNIKAIQTLREITTTEIEIVIKLLEYFKINNMTKDVMLPTEKDQLLPPEDCVFDDREWSSNAGRKENLRNRFEFVHPKVTGDLAEYFHVTPVTTKLAALKKVTIFKKSGQNESLTRRIKGIIEDYKDNIDVFKELIQNADDAGATEVKFLIDWRQHPTENLFTDEMKHWQGPALYAYNNSVFTDEDVRNICELGGATKKDNPMKIGRFGLGFCATYHLTDVPSFVSRHQLTIFDPHKRYIKDAIEGDSPGLFVDFVSKTSDLNDYLRGQVEPYEGVFGCSCLKAEEYNGTLFRFPFRNDATAQQSDISPIVFEESQVDELLEAFRQASNTILVFLKNVKHIQLYTLSKSATVCDTVLLGDITRKEVTSPRNLIKEFKATSLPKRFCSQFTIQSSFEGNAPSTEWIVSSAVGCAESLKLAQSQGKGFIPFAEIAVPVKKHNSMLIPYPIKGQLFCFLPLPISTELKCLLNGTFEVTKERRHLKDLMENPAVKSWNKLLIEDAVVLAFIELLSYLCKGYRIVHEARDKQQILQPYYDMWPLCDDASFTAPDPFLSVLEEAFVKYLHDSNEELIVTDTGELKAMADVFVENLQQNYRTNTFDSKMIALCKEVMISDGIPLATLPQRIAKKCVQHSQMIDFRMYCDKHFFHNFTCHKESVRDKHMLFILSKYQQLEDTSDEWLKDTCCSVRCIPTQPNSELVTPSHLVMPDSSVAQLYSVEDGRFPTEAYLDEAVLRTLLEFGIKKDQLEEDDIVERAESVSILPKLDAQKQRSLNIVKYLSSRPHRQITSACRRLNNVRFLPTLSVEFGVEQLCTLAAPSEMYLPKHAQLVFTHSVILDYNSALVTYCPDLLFQFKTTPSVGDVVRHLKNIVIYTNSGDNSGKKLDPTNVEKIVKEIYEFLESEVTKDLFFNIMLDEPFIWDNDDGIFVDSSKVAISLPSDLKSLNPYRKTSTDIQCLTKYRDLWKKLGVSQRLTVNDCITVLKEMSTSVHLEKDNVDLAIQILEYLKLENCAKEYALIPTVSGTLVSPDKCIYDDRQWSTKKEDLRNRFIFTHEKVIESLIEYFGILPLSSEIAQPKKLKIEARATGQHESLTRRLKGIIEDYKDSIDVFKELIQNADDAGATEVKFLIDWRQHPTEKLLTNEMRHWQGPALYAYNNSVFTDEDFRNICELGGATKKDNPMKIGRFGLGFCTVYRITDLPSFVSRSTLVLFDPHTTNLGDLIANDQPGLEFNFVKQAKDIDEYYHDQIAVYQGVFDCDIKKEYPGTLFRLPFRSEAMAERSEICDEPFCCQDTITKLVDSLFQYADQILLFLHNLRKVELHINTNVNCLDSQLVMEVARNDTDVNEQSDDTFCTESKQVSIELVSYNKEVETSSSSWLVSSAKALQGCHICSSPHCKQLNPKIEVATQIGNTTDNKYIPKPLEQGRVFCFLPLPITIDQKFLINGQFIVSKDRRHLEDLEGRSFINSDKSWNRLLIHEVAPRAVLELIHKLTTVISSSLDSDVADNTLQEYYSIWPLRKPTHPLSEELRNVFPHMALTYDYPIVWSMCGGGKWLPLKDVNTLERTFTYKMFGEAQKDILDVLVQCNYKMAVIPTPLLRVLEETLQKRFTTSIVTVVEYVIDILLPNLTDIEDNLQIRQMLFLLEHYDTLNDICTSDRSNDGLPWLKGPLQAQKCIPCEPDGQLSIPQDLVSPNNKFSSLFMVEEERFPLTEFLDNAVVRSTLLKLGMCDKCLRRQDVVGRAHRASKVSEDGILRYCSVFSDYLVSEHSNMMEENGQLIEELAQIPFFPLFLRPDHLTLPWHHTKNSVAKPVEMYQSEYLSLVFSFGMIPDTKVIGDKCLALFSQYMKHKPSITEVQGHLLSIVKWAAEKDGTFTENDTNFLNKHMNKIYSHMEYVFNCDEGESFTEDVIKPLKNQPFLWVNGRFNKPSQCVQSCHFHYYPYLDVVKLDCRNLLTKAGVEYSVTAGKAKVILKQIAEEYAALPVAEELISFISQLVSVIAKSYSTLHYAESEVSGSGPYYLPDGNRVMCPAEKLVCKEWDDPEKTSTQKKLMTICPPGTKYLHASIPKSEASKLGVVDVLSYVLELLSDDDFDSDDVFEQHEPLTIRLNSLLKQYKGDMTIFKEFIQNADDAEATEIAFILDHRCNFGTESLIGQTATAQKWSELQKVPSLLVYNNHRFTDEDIKGITQLGKGSKDGEANKIGRFGVGFNVAYHVTDCPMFLSFGKEGKAENYCVFDPNKVFLPYHLGRKRKAGKRINFNKVTYKHAFDAFADQFEPFLQDKMGTLKEAIPTGFEDHSNGYVVFRLPLTRCETTEYTMDLRLGEKMTLKKLTDLSATFKEHAPSMLLFLNHLKRISFLEIKSDGSIKQPWTVLATNTTDYSKQRNFTKLNDEALAEIKVKKGESTKVVKEVFDINIEMRESSLSKPISCKWLVSKRFGGTDVNKDLLKETYEKVHLIPVVAVAAPNTRDTHRGKLFCSLPLPHETNSPFHIHGHFSIDPSRQHIVDDSWNQSLVADIVSKAYVSLLYHAKHTVEASSDKSLAQWFYKLFLLADYAPPLIFLKELLKPAYQLLVKDKATILLSNSDKPRHWFCLTDDDEHDNKGWFCHNTPALVDVLTAIGVKLTLAPDKLQKTVRKLIPSYQGVVTPALVRAALRTISHSYPDYWDIIMSNIAELLEFVIKDLTCSNVHEMNGLPLMLTQSGLLEKIQLDKPLFSLDYINLFDSQQSHVGNAFVHQDLPTKHIQFLRLVVDVTPEFVANHIKSCIVRDEEVTFNEEIRGCLCLLWRFILKHCKNEQVQKVFGHLAVLPTSRGTLVPLLHSLTVLDNYGQNKNVLLLLKIPVVDFSLIFSEDEAITSASYLQRILGDSGNPDSVLLALVETLRKHSELYQTFVPPNKTEVMKFILFIQSSTHVPQYQKELRKLCIFQSTNGNWTNACTQQTVYAVKKSPTTLYGVECLENRVHIVLLYEECEKFFQNVGITVLNSKTFYKSIIIPHFEHLPAKSRIHHLKAIDNMVNKEDLLLLLQSRDFIEHFEQQSRLLRPSVFFDPEVALFKTFLEQKRFPPSPWDTPDVLIILRNLGLIVEADTNRIMEFAQIVSQECSANDTRTKALVRDIKRRVKEALCRNAEPEKWRNLLELCANIKLICFLPSYYPADLRTALQCTKAICTFPRADELVCFNGSVLCPTQDSSIACLCHPVIDDSLVMPTQLGEERRNYLLSVLGAIPIIPELVARNLLKLTELVGTCTLSSDSTASIKCFQKVFKAHYVYLSTNPLEKDSPQVAELKKVSCIFVPSVSGNSLKLVQGCKLVERVAHENRAYSQYISPIPDYLDEHCIKHFRESVGIERTLSAAHFVSFFNDIKEELCQNNEEFHKDRNLEQAVQDGYHDFLVLLQSNDYNATAYVENVLAHDGVIYLPSDTGEMLPSTDLVLCDDKWLRDTIPKESHPKFILPPLSTTLPLCLKVQTLSVMVTEKLDVDLLEDRYNRCDKELYAEQNNLGHTCEDVVSLKKLLLSEEFGTGLLRIMSDKSPLTDVQRECVRTVQSLRIVCVRNIETKLSYKGNSFPGTKEVVLVDVTSKSLYVCFHNNGGVEDPQVQEEITLQLYKKVIDSFISDSSHLRAIIKQVANPSKIEAALDRLHIAHYKPESTQNTGILGERNVVINDDFELLVLCNFRKYEHVKYCDSDGIVKVAMVVDIPQISEESGSQLPPMPPKLNLVTTGQDIKKSISCLLICKYITARQRKVIKSQLTGSISVDSSSNASDEKVVLLKLPMDGENLLRYIQDVLDSFSDNVCKYFAIERLLFQLHYWCVIERKSAKDMASLIDKFLHCVLTMCQLDQGDEDNKEFLRNLVRKADAMLGRNQPTPPQPTVPASTTEGGPQPTVPVSTTAGGPQPIVSNVPTGSDGAFSYTSYSSWSIPQNIQGLQCSSYWSTPWTVAGLGPSRVNVVSRHLPQSAALLPAHQLGGEVWENAESEPTTSISEAVMWLQQACRDLELAKYLMPGHDNEDQEEINCNYPEAVCFYAHEVVEKALKAVYLGYCGLKQELASSHHIVNLCERLKVHPDCPQPIKEASTQSHVFFVSRHGNCCRFPDCNLPPAPPMLTHSKTTAREVLATATRFLGIVATFEKFADLFPSGELDRIVIPNIDKEFPSTWQPLPDNKDHGLFVVLKDSPEYTRIANLFHETLPRRRIHCIERIQNKELWIKYKNRKTILQRDPDLGQIEELSLFHGTRETRPEMIYGSETGFDTRFSRDGLWGFGNYFAVNASYSLRYSHNKGNRQLQMLVARVLPGASKGCGHQRVKYTVPPERESSVALQPGQVRRRYNTVNAIAGGSKIYIAYENDLAYPEYLITFES